jgi:hypothetical protein
LTYIISNVSTVFSSNGSARRGVFKNHRVGRSSRRSSSHDGCSRRSRRRNRHGRCRLSSARQGTQVFHGVRRGSTARRRSSDRRGSTGRSRRGILLVTLFGSRIGFRRVESSGQGLPPLSRRDNLVLLHRPVRERPLLRPLTKDAGRAS